ncbi:MAG: hypothetical protein JO154_17180 [Chitinophaga sp.]|nr:hypothetical protein [Chitinophaga sp.]
MKQDNKQYILLEVLSAGNLHGYFLTCKNLTTDEFHTPIVDPFFFPPTHVEKGDYIAVFLGSGKHGRGKFKNVQKDGHIFFWEHSDAISSIEDVNLKELLVARVYDKILIGKN